MRSTLRVRLAVIALCLAGISSASAETSSCHPDRLRTEYLVNPLGIDVAQPRMDWILSGSVEAPRNLSQASYQILVASTPEILAQDKGDLWDSGVVKSDETSQIAYGGPALTSRQICYWKVRVTDSLGKTSAWSKPASWEMGLLKPEDWQAKWIEAKSIMADPAKGTISIKHATYEATDGHGSKDVTDLISKLLQNNSLTVQVTNSNMGGDAALNHTKQLRVDYTFDGKDREAITNENATLRLPESSGSLPYLRKDFTITKSIAKARIYVTALGLYELRLNGERVGDHILAPDWTDYFIRSRYQVYDVTSMLKSGANTWGALVGNGWYCGHIGNGGFESWGKVPALFAQLEVTYGDGTTDRIVTDASWKVRGGPILSSDFMLGENYDAQDEIPGWDKPGLDVSSWAADTERTEAARPLDGQVDQAVRQTGEMHPKTMKETTPGHWTYDFGQNMVGVLRLKVKAPAGTRIQLRHAEMLNPDGTIYTTNLRGAPSIDTYICKGGEEETWQPRFTFHGFRYAEVSGLPGVPTLDTVTGIVLGTDIPRHSSFSTSNPDVNQLQSNIQWGMRGNYLSVPTDCPQRDERMGWMGDAEAFIRTATYNGDVAAFFTKWLVDVDDAQKPDGAYTDVSPSPHGAGGGNGGVPAWGDAGVICPWTIYLVYGDKRILEQHLPNMKRWVDWCQLHSTNLIRDKDRGPDYGDWLWQNEDTNKELIGTAFFAYSTSLLAKSYAAVGDTANADKYQQLFEQIKTAFDQRYVEPDGHIKNATQTSYVLALRFDLLPDDLRPKAAQYLVENIKAHHNHLTTGFVGVTSLLPALMSENQVDAAYTLLEQDTFPSWLFSVKHGATTIWERWDGWTPEKGFQDPGMNSFNHYALGSCGQWMFDTVAGIGVDTTQPAFHHIIIRPRPGGDLTHAEGIFDSIHGKIETNWKLENGKFSLHVVVPINTTATIDLPVAKGVQEGGQDIEKIPDIKIRVYDGDPNPKYIVGSGSYDFTCNVP